MKFIKQIQKLSNRLEEITPKNISEDKNDSKIVSSDAELKAYHTIKSILAEKLEMKRISQRDTKSYFSILLDDNSRKWIARLHFHYSIKYLEVRVDEKNSKKIQLEKIEDIYNCKDELIKSLEMLFKKSHQSY